MALTFPNLSRSYDETGKRVRFSGYDGMFEVPFFIEIEALEKKMKHPARTEASYLAAFDDARAEIIVAAMAVYHRGGRTPFVLTASSF
ncbi:DUF1488 domain-containing protein [Hoeflea poritis]|uniref:DUF1488 domain-containing protein n=1 Tax=Hoeflea poritis TaxID=2993659 RepID=A0ABT4VVY1_9HYPH|nr:DUF1488 domain-containing protein [Hoeflea poritis]MDA4848864.1 DUF1488 domain-containing protein [Hoeflea poritis]